MILDRRTKGHMQSGSPHFKPALSYALALTVVMAIHVLVAFSKLKITDGENVATADQNQPLKLKSFRQIDFKQVGSKDSKTKDFSSFRKYAPVRNDKQSAKKIKLSDLAAGTSKIPRPGSRPQLAQEKNKPIDAISLKGKQILEFTKGANAVAMSGDPRASQLTDTDILVNLEVPEGVEPDELNKYEMMFYGFQRRTAINYINSFYKNLDTFQRENPHLNFPLTENKQVMTGRLTYDEKGNIKQIKMIRWSHEERLQGFFENVLKEMDVLHNPPQALWKKNGEFSIFFSFVVNG